MSTLVADEFGRTVSGGWGTPDVGAAWSVSPDASAFAVAGGVGTITLGVVGSETATAAMTAATAAGRVAVSLSAVPTGAIDLLILSLRAPDASNGYRLVVGISTLAAVQVTLQKLVSGASSTIAATVTLPGITYAPGTKLWMMLDTTGSSIRGWVWRDGDAQPIAPTLSATDTSLTTSAQMRLVYQTQTGATGLPRTASFDSLTVADPTAKTGTDTGTGTEAATAGEVHAFPPPIVALSWTSATGETVDLQGDPTGVRVNLVEGLDELPVVRRADDLVPFVPGRLRADAIADRRALLLAGYIKTPDDYHYRAIIAGLQRAMDPTTGAGTLTATLEDGQVRTIDALPLGIAYVGRIRTGKSLTIELDADPYWRGVLDPGWRMDTGLAADTALTMDSGDAPVSLVPAADPASVAFAVVGTTATLDPVVQVDGPSTAAISVVNADGIGFGFRQLTAGETLVVDAGARSATIGVASVRAALTLRPANPRGAWFLVRPGAETVTVTGHPAAVRIAYTPTYL